MSKVQRLLEELVRSATASIVKAKEDFIMRHAHSHDFTPQQALNSITLVQTRSGLKTRTHLICRECDPDGFGRIAKGEYGDYVQDIVDASPFIETGIKGEDSGY